MKGVDPLLATILLLVIAVSVAAVVANWQSWFLPRYASQLTRTQSQCMQAGIALESISYNCSNSCLPGIAHTLKASIRNTGDISLPLYALFLESMEGRMFEFKLGTTLALDQVFSYENVSLADCSGINRSIARIRILTACTSMPSTFDGSMIEWISC